eukprot:snap_masked-scaffold_2-processed-gene-15.18-mRNA-1 protein AED:0.09 eAED:0.09 QI:0/-1/0/1/-1/1/1/0/144
MNKIFSFLCCIRTPEDNHEKTVRNLLEKTENEKNRILETSKAKSLKKSLNQTAERQKKILEQNPEFLEQLKRLESSLGKDSNYEKAALKEILEQSRKIMDSDPILRKQLKKQEALLSKDQELLQNLSDIGKLKQEILNTQIEVC